MAPAPLDPARLGARVLVVAPHPDDESIGCGGLIALLRRQGAAVHVAFVTDGTGSHPKSRDYPPARLSALRRQEAREALGILGVAGDAVSFLGLEDRFVPAKGEADHAGAVRQASACLDGLHPETLVLPAPTDSHGDHRAAALIWRAAVRRARGRPRVLDYLVWGDERAPGEPRWRIDIGPVRALKLQAIAAHRSQHGLVVRDDPEGFVLPPALLARAARSFELYDEVAP